MACLAACVVNHLKINGYEFCRWHVKMEWVENIGKSYIAIGQLSYMKRQKQMVSNISIRKDVGMYFILIRFIMRHRIVLYPNWTMFDNLYTLSNILQVIIPMMTVMNYIISIC